MEVAVQDFIEIDPASSLAEREQIIIKALDFSDRLRWRAFMELKHIKETKQYLELRHGDSSPVFPTFEAYLEDFRERIPNTSRRLIFSRIGLLRKLHDGLGVPVEEITEKSPVKLEAITRLGVWDKKGNLLSQEQGSVVSAEKMRVLVEETTSQRTGDTLAMVDEMLGKNRILFYGSKREDLKGSISVEIRAVETRTGEVYSINGAISQIVVDEFEKRLDMSFESGA